MLNSEYNSKENVEENKDKSNMADTSEQGETYSSILQTHHTQNYYDIEEVKPVFILESDLFGSNKPSRDQFLTHLELYKIIDATVCPASHLRGLQRVRGMWRIYLDSETDRESLIISGISIRNKLIQVYTRNPRITQNEYPEFIKVRVKNIPCSAEDGQIERCLEFNGCKYKALVLHQGQDNHTGHYEISCNKCLQKGHKYAQCPNDWVCRQCHKEGHRQAECDSPLSEVDETHDQNSDGDEAGVDNQEPQSKSVPQREENAVSQISIAPLDKNQTSTNINTSDDSEKAKKKLNSRRYSR
ncbi:unnamed protein product [Mytilus edulis]|uniref:CCHC-type domain-containing protein n=1 Tax=Mytilus edulis TaxID=6550 RepID=A0A8S3QT60_MYTED|nr:unnamed protein product [Mytilus edulis]